MRGLRPDLPPAFVWSHRRSCHTVIPQLTHSLTHSLTFSLTAAKHANTQTRKTAQHENSTTCTPRDTAQFTTYYIAYVHLPRKVNAYCTYNNRCLLIVVLSFFEFFRATQRRHPSSFLPSFLPSFIHSFIHSLPLTHCEANCELPPLTKIKTQKKTQLRTQQHSAPLTH